MTPRLTALLALGLLAPFIASAADAPAPSLESAPPVVVKTVPVAGETGVDPSLAEISVTFSKPMQDGSWSWSTWGEGNDPESTGQPRYLADGRTCVLPVKLQPGRFYALWLNSERFRNFKDSQQRPAVPYLLTFETAGPKTAPAASPAGVSAASGAPATDRLNADQRLVVAWTDRQFRGFFDGRTFEGWSATERADLQARMIDALKGPRSREYYQAINTLAALGGTNALPALRALAFDRNDKDNRDRWMAIRALGLLDDRAAIPDLIHLVYHGNSNTRWWAQISLVRLTGENFGNDWQAWGWWWNARGEPAFQPGIVRWWNGQAEPERLAESLAESDRKFLDGIRG